MSRRLAVLLSVAALAVPLAPQAEAVSVSQTFTVPASGRFTIQGHGFGHGHGMSQYGAYGAARQGLTSTQILRFYYPGTTLERRTGWLRVLLTAHTGRDLVVTTAPGMVLRDRGTMKDYPLPADLDATRWRLGVGGTHTVVDYRTTSGWHRYRPGGLAQLVGDGVLRSTAGRLTLVDGATRKVYRDRLGAVSPHPGTADRATVNIVRYDSYVKGVVPAEMPALWSPAAVQAQAVAARTYAAWSAATHAGRYYSICDTSACQVYAGYAGEHPAANAAVDATYGRILTWKGKPAFTQFGSSSGGWTSDGGQPYLPAHEDPYDDWSGNPVHDWSVRVGETTLERRYPSLGDLRRITVTSREGGGEWKGRALAVTLVGSRASVRVTGGDLRSAYGLRSTWFSFTR